MTRPSTTTEASTSTSPSGPAAPAQTTGGKPVPFWRRSWKRLLALLAIAIVVAQGLSTLVGGGGAAVKVWHLAFPSSPAVSASIAAGPALLDRPFSLFLSWVRKRPEVQNPPQSVTRSEPSVVGVIHPVHLKVEGLSGKEVTLHWAMSDNRTTQPIAISATWPRTLRLRPPSNNWSADEQIWVPIPLHANGYVLELTLTTPGRTDPIAGPTRTAPVATESG